MGFALLLDRPWLRAVLYWAGGTQVIDRFWSTLRKYLGYRSKNVQSAATEARVRSAQWEYWHGDKDLWVAMGETLTDMH